SSRLAAPQLKSSSPPRKTLSGRRIIAPNSVTTSLSPSHILRSTCAPTTKRSAAQTAARSAVRKATARVSARRNQQTKTEPGKASPPPSSSPSPINHETKKRRGRPPRKSLVSGDTASQEPPAPSAEMTPKQEPPKSPVPIKQEAVKPKSPPAVPRSTATLTSASYCVRPSTIVGSVLTTSASPSPSRHPALSSSPFKAPVPPQPRFPVRTLSRHSQLPLPPSSPLSNMTSARTPFQSSPVRLPVRVLQSPPSTSRPSSQPVSVSGSSIQSSPPLLVRRPGTLARVAVPVSTVPTQRAHQRYVVVGRSANNVPVVMPTTVRHSGAVPVRRVIVQARATTQAQSPVIQRPGLGEYERPRLQFRSRTSSQDSTTEQQ
ncbi:hypothetical protein COOONC_17630, partial [Cooperia oncophora]